MSQTLLQQTEFPEQLRPGALQLRPGAGGELALSPSTSPLSMTTVEARLRLLAG